MKTQLSLEDLKRACILVCKVPKALKRPLPILKVAGLSPQQMKEFFAACLDADFALPVFCSTKMSSADFENILFGAAIEAKYRGPLFVSQASRGKEVSLDFFNARAWSHWTRPKILQATTPS